MKQKIITVVIVFALIFASLSGLLGSVKNAKALSVTSVVAAPNTANSVSQITISIQTAGEIAGANGFIMVAFPSGFLIPSNIYSSQITINSTLHPYGNVNVAGQVLWFFVGTTIPAGTVNIVFSTSAGIRTPATSGIYQIQVQTSSETAQYGSVVIRDPSPITNTSINLVPLTPGSLVQYCYISFKTGPAGALAEGQTVSLAFPSGTVVPPFVNNGSITMNTVAVTSGSVSGTTLSLVVPTGVVIGNSTQVNIGISSLYGIRNPIIPGNYQVQISTAVDTAYASTPTYQITGSSVSNVNLQVYPLNPGVPAMYSIYFVTSPSGALVYGDTVSITFPSTTIFPSNLNLGLVQVNTGMSSSVTRNGYVVTVAIPYGTSIAAGGFVQITFPTTLGITNSTIGTYNLSIATSKDTFPVISNSFQIVGSSISNLSGTITPTAQASPAEFKFVFYTSPSGTLAANSGYITIDFPTEVSVPSSISKSNITVNGSNPYSVSVLTGKAVKIVVPFNVPANSALTIVISSAANIKNPAAYGITSNISVSTSADTVPVYFSYITTISEITKPQITLSSYGVGIKPDITITFNTGANGAIKTGTDKIIIIFPYGFVLPSSIQRELVKVNNSIAYGTYIYGNRLEITSNANISANSTIKITIDKSSGITNPSVPSQYTIQAYTTAESSIVSSAAFNIVALPVSTLSITPENPDGLNGYYKTLPTIALKASSPTDPSPTIFYSINTASFQIYNGTITIPSGNITFKYYAQDKSGNVEETKTLNLKVDNTPPVLFTTSPLNDYSTNQKSLKINGKTEAGAMLFNGNSQINVASDGMFETTVELVEGLQTITFTATDPAGNSSTFQLRITLDDIAPKITITSPLMYSTTSNKTCKVVGTTEVDAIVTINKISVAVNSDGSFSGNVTLVPGQNAIEVIATDKMGNARKSTTLVNYVASTTILLQVGNKTASVNGKTISLLTQPLNISGTVLVPIRFISEAFGANVEWDPTFRSITIKLDTSVVRLQIGNLVASVNGKTSKLTTAPIIKNSTTLVPIRFISEAFNSEVNWNSKTQSVSIIFPKP